MSHEHPNVTLRLADVGSDDAAACALMTDHMTWALAELKRHYSVEMHAEVTHTPESLAQFRDPRGFIALAEIDGIATGVGALRTLDATTVEVKRMYVSPEYRSCHVGSAVLDHLLLMAKERTTASVVVLDTCRFMTDAQSLYRSRGFTERTPYRGTEIPRHLQKYWRFFQRDLRSDRLEDSSDLSTGAK